MGNLCAPCLRPFLRRKVLRQYTSLDAAQSVDDGSTLFDDDGDGDGLMSTQQSSGSAAPAITENEKLLLKSKNYAAIIKAQKKYDEQIDKQLAEQEERLRAEEEEQQRIKRLNNSKVIHKLTASSATPTQSSTSDPWVAGDNSEWNVAGGEDDFDMFLDSIAVRERSKGEPDDDEINEDDFVSGFTDRE